MQTLIMVGQFILSLSILIFIHELGHFLAAKMFKTRVDKFYLFFDFMFPLSNVLNFALFKKKIGDTEYGLGWFPLGGYVSIAGMIDETTDKEALSKEPEPWEYRSKKNWQKMIIIMGGIIFNIIFAFLIFFSLLKFSKKEYVTAESLKNGGMTFTEPAKKFGFQDGDYIVNVNGNEVERIDDLIHSSVLFGGYYTVLRKDSLGNSQTLKLDMPKDFFKTLRFGPLFFPKYHYIKVEKVASGINQSVIHRDDIILNINDKPIDNFEILFTTLDSLRNQNVKMQVKRNEKIMELSIKVDTAGKVGFVPGFIPHYDKYALKPYDVFASIKFGFYDCWKTFYIQVLSFKKMGSGEMDIKENVGGPIKMAQMFGYDWNWLRFWSLTALISMGLAFMNALPIPALDGGHAIVILFEMITGKKVSDKVLSILQTIGTVMVLALMIYVFYLDGSSLMKK